jgi:hypothetical protein
MNKSDKIMLFLIKRYDMKTSALQESEQSASRSGPLNPGATGWAPRACVVVVEKKVPPRNWLSTITP